MSILFRHKSPLKSAEFNQRFGDVVGGSILRGFFFEPGTNELDINIVSGNNETNLLITKSGVRIEEEDLMDVITLNPNTFSVTRIDTIYAKYIHGQREAVVEYVVADGYDDGSPAYVESEDTHVLLGYVHLPDNASDLAGATFEYPERGWRLQDVANEATFKSLITFDKNIHIPEPTHPNEGANKSYVDEKIQKEVHEGLPYASITSEFYNPKSRTFEEVTYRRSNGTAFLKTLLSDMDRSGRFTTILLSRFADDGVTEVDNETWRLTYNEYGNITSKTRV